MATLVGQPRSAAYGARRVSTSLLTGLLLVLLMGVPTADAAGMRLSDGIRGLFRIEVLLTTPDSKTAVFAAWINDGRFGQRLHLYATDIATGRPRVLARDLLDYGDRPRVSEPEIVLSPDGRYALYHADRNANRRAELYAVPVAGGRSVRLDGPDRGYVARNGTMVSGSASRAVFLKVRDGKPHLYSTPLAGGPVTRLNGSLPAFATVASFDVSRDGRDVVYLADVTTEGSLELFSVPVAGGSVTRLSPAVPAERPGLAVAGYDVSADRVVYASGSPDGSAPIHCSHANPVCATVGIRKAGRLYHLRSVPIGGGPSTTLAADPRGKLAASLKLSPDGRRVLYFRGKDLFSVPATGGAPVQLSVTAPERADGVTRAGFTPDGQFVIYDHDDVPDLPARDHRDLYAVPVAGGSRVNLTGNLISNGNVPGQTRLVQWWTWTPHGGRVPMDWIVAGDGRTVLFQVRSEVHRGLWAGKVFASTVTGGGPRRLLRTQGSFGVDLALARGGMKIVLDDQRSLSVMPVAGGPRVTLRTLPYDGYATQWQTTANGRHVLVYRQPYASTDLREVDPRLFSHHIGR